jgi:hypothetical protein
MNHETFEARRQSVSTPSGRITYVEQGEGPVALFVHGVIVNGYLWRHQLGGSPPSAGASHSTSLATVGVRRVPARTSPSRLRQPCSHPITTAQPAESVIQEE